MSSVAATAPPRKALLIDGEYLAARTPTMRRTGESRRRFTAACVGTYFTSSSHRVLTLLGSPSATARCTAPVSMPLDVVRGAPTSTVRPPLVTAIDAPASVFVVVTPTPPLSDTVPDAAS